MPASNALGVPRCLPPKHIIVCCVLSVLLWLNPRWYLCAFSWKRTDVLQQTRGADIKTRREKSPPPHPFCQYNRKRSRSDLRIKHMHNFRNTKSQGNKREGLQCSVVPTGAELRWLTDLTQRSLSVELKIVSTGRELLYLCSVIGTRHWSLSWAIINPARTVRPTCLRSEIHFSNILPPIPNSFKYYLTFRYQAGTL